MPQLKICTEKFDITEISAMKYGHCTVDDSIIVPDIKPDIKRVLDVSAGSCVTEVTPGQDKIHAEGIFRAVILYLPDGDVMGKVKKLELKREFGCTIEAKGVTADNTVSAESEIGSVDTTFINSGKLNIRAVIDIGVKIGRVRTFELPADIAEQPAAPALPSIAAFLSDTDKAENSAARSTPKLELRKTPVRLCSDQFSADTAVVLHGSHEISGKLPQIGEVLTVSVIPEAERTVVSDGKIRISGNAQICVLYEDIGDGKNTVLRTAEFTVPYSEELDAPDSADDAECETEYHVREVYAEAADNTDGEKRIINIEAVLGAAISGYTTAEPQVITDAYNADDHDLNIEFAEAAPEQLIHRMTAQISLKATLKKRPTDADIGGICFANTEKTSVSDIDISDGRACVKGSVSVKLLCTSSDENQPLFSLADDIPFEHCFDIDRELSGKAACDAKIFVDHISYTISGSNSADVRITVGISIRLIKNDPIRMISAIEYDENDNAEESGEKVYIIYFTQPGDTLWSIAKKYKTGTDDLAAANNITNPDNLRSGQRIRIVK